MPRPPIGLRAWLSASPAIATLFAAWMVWSAGTGLYATFWTIFIQDLGATPFQIGLVLGGGAIARTLLSLPAGLLVDRFSAFPIMVSAMSLPVPGVLLLAVSSTWWHALIAASVIELSGIAVPAVSARIAAETNDATRTPAYTWIFMIAPQLGLIAGPVVGGQVVDHEGFRAVFVVAAALFAVGVAILFRLNHGAPARSHDRIVTDTDGKADADVAPAAGGVLAPLADPGIRAVVLLHLLVPLLPYTGFVLLANTLANDRHLDAGTIGMLGSVGAASGLLTGLLVSHWRPLSGPFLGLAVCLAAAALAMLILIFPVPSLLLVVAFVLRGMLSPVFSLMSAATARLSPAHIRGRVFGLAETAAGAGDIAAPVAGGALYGVSSVLPLIAGLITTVPQAAWALRLHTRFGTDAGRGSDPTGEPLE